MKSDSENTRIAIIGLGNLLLADDGVGVHAVRALKQNCPAGIVIAEAGSAILHCQHLLEDADHVIAIDAAHADGPPGTIYHFRADDVQIDQQFSLHDLGIIGVLKLIPDHLRPTVHIIGVEPEIIDYSMELSPTVGAVLPQLLEAVRRTVNEITQRDHQAATFLRRTSDARQKTPIVRY